MMSMLYTKLHHDNYVDELKSSIEPIVENIVLHSKYL